MKKIFCVLILISFNLKSQTIMTFQDMEKNNIRMTKLDSLYPNCINTATSTGVFSGEKEKEFEKVWGDFYMQLFTYFGDNGLKWGKQTYCFNKIYFDKTGKVEYWFFNFKKADNVPQDKQDKYLELLKKFARDHKLKIKSTSNYSQCASVDFVDM